MSTSLRGRTGTTSSSQSKQKLYNCLLCQVSLSGLLVVDNINRDPGNMNGNIHFKGEALYQTNIKTLLPFLTPMLQSFPCQAQQKLRLMLCCG